MTAATSQAPQSANAAAAPGPAPVLAAPAPGTQGLPAIYTPAALSAFLAAERRAETGSYAGNYSSLPYGRGGASGAYQFEPATWQEYAAEVTVSSNGKTAAQLYPIAADAPAAVQDAVAQVMALTYLKQTGDWGKVAASWYDPSKINQPDYVPPGNSLSIGQYENRVLGYMRSFAGITPSSAGAVTSNSGLVGTATLGAVGTGTATNAALGAISDLPSAAVSAAKNLATAAAWLSSRHNWIRVLEVGGGLVGLVVALFLISSDLRSAAGHGAELAAVA